MTKNSARPTWELNGQHLPATFPAVQLDPEVALQAALDCNKGHERMHDVVTLTKAAATYAAETMREALAEFAIMVRDADLGIFSSSAGWTARHVPGPRPSTIDLMVEHPIEPGGWFYSFHFEKEMTEAAAARNKELRDVVRTEQNAKGLTPQEAIMRELFAKDGDLSEAEAAVQALKQDPSSYRPAQAGDAIRRVAATALILKSGAPEGVEDAAAEKDVLPVKEYPKIWWRGMELDLAPMADYQREEDSTLSGSTERAGASQHVPLMLLSDFLESNGLSSSVKALDEKTSKRSWKSYGDQADVLLLEAGHACVHAANGLFDQSVVDRIASFSAGIAAQDVARFVDDWVDVAPRLVEQGYDAGNRYDCNDGRTICDAAQDGEDWVLRLRTQHGNYVMRIGTGEDGKADRIEAYRSSVTMIPVGRFVRTSEGLSAAYEEEPAIAYTIRNVRDMNGIILAWSSITCCFDEDHPKQTMSMG